MLYSYLSQIKFVVEAKMEGGSFEDKYIAKFWQKLHVSINIYKNHIFQFYTVKLGYNEQNFNPNCSF